MVSESGTCETDPYTLGYRPHGNVVCHFTEHVFVILQNVSAPAAVCALDPSGQARLPCCALFAHSLQHRVCSWGGLELCIVELYLVSYWVLSECWLLTARASFSCGSILASALNLSAVLACPSETLSCMRQRDQADDRFSYSTFSWKKLCWRSPPCALSWLGELRTLPPQEGSSLCPDL